MTDLIQPDAQGDFIPLRLGVWPRPSVDVCGAYRPDLPDLPCVLAVHLDGQHEDEDGEEWETVEFGVGEVSGRG